MISRDFRIRVWIVGLYNRLRERFIAREPSLPPAKTASTFQRLDSLAVAKMPSPETLRDGTELSHEGQIEDGQTVYAIGDVHGRADLLERLITAVRADCHDAPLPATIVFLGDYIDRGFQSKQVIDLLCALQTESDFNTVFLKGNHEQALLKFLDDAAIGPDWSAFGGRETLISYGVIPPRNVKSVDEWRTAQTSLRQSIPVSHVEFLESLPSHHRIGSFGFVHAGIRPGIPFAEQSDEDRLWIRDIFLNAPNKEDLFIVHGHSPVDTPFVDHRRVNIDTGAYFTGTLCAVKLTNSGMSFITNHSLDQGE